VISILSRLSHRPRWDDKTLKFLETLRKEVFMYLVLIVVFYPRRRVSDIKIGKEQMIAFILGVLGILHTQLNLFEGFFLDINSLIRINLPICKRKPQFIL